MGQPLSVLPHSESWKSRLCARLVIVGGTLRYRWFRCPWLIVSFVLSVVFPYVVHSVHTSRSRYDEQSWLGAEFKVEPSDTGRTAACRWCCCRGHRPC